MEPGQPSFNQTMCNTWRLLSNKTVQMNFGTWIILEFPHVGFTEEWVIVHLIRFKHKLIVSEIRQIHHMLHSKTHNYLKLFLWGVTRLRKTYLTKEMWKSSLNCSTKLAIQHVQPAAHRLQASLHSYLSTAYGIYWWQYYVTIQKVGYTWVVPSCIIKRKPYTS